MNNRATLFYKSEINKLTFDLQYREKTGNNRF